MTIVIADTTPLHYLLSIRNALNDRRECITHGLSTGDVTHLKGLVRRLVYRAMDSKSRSLCHTGTRLSMAIAAMRQSVEERIV